MKVIVLLHGYLGRNMFHWHQLCDPDLPHAFPFILHQCLVEFITANCLIIHITKHIYLRYIFNMVTLLLLHCCFIFVMSRRSDFFEFLFSLNIVDCFIRKVWSFWSHFYWLFKRCFIWWTLKTFVMGSIFRDLNKTESLCLMVHRIWL